MGFGFARRRREELEQVSDSGISLPEIDVLARFAYVGHEVDESLEEHQHDGPCNCSLRGE